MYLFYTVGKHKNALCLPHRTIEVPRVFDMHHLLTYCDRPLSTVTQCVYHSVVLATILIIIIILGKVCL